VNYFLLLLDVRPEPVGQMSWGPLILLLGIVLVLSVGFASGLIFFLIWLKRRKQRSS
jgi:hypothetical protein